MRAISRTYLDPLDHIWLTAARRIGLRVERSDDVYAATDGRGTVRLGTAETLDPDDCLAQMIFHELCHSLVEGPDSFAQPDWGLDNTGDRHVANERACLRAQAALADEYGLRGVLAPTTEFRPFYDDLPQDPLEPRELHSVTLAILGVRRAERPPWAPHLRQALDATATVARASHAFVEPDARSPSLWSAVAPAPERHPVGFPMAADPARTCGTCAWTYQGGRGLPVARCRQADGARVAADMPACTRWEASLDCLACGACCREAYHSVTVSRREPVVAQRPDLIVDRGRYLELARAPTETGTRCVALSGGGSVPTSAGADRTRQPHSCAIYDLRPRPCRDLESGGVHCLTARRRVGLSR